ncbi:MAG: pantetheine-phosphate adenylyltransferase [Sulfobacillus sp.]|nr:pantetheine-phosphate adenylyltransferase [Sulfobacillus sp.]
MKTQALYPGSFDPLHNGHLDVIERASRIFDHLVVTVFVNAAKHPVFDPETRVRLVREATSHLPNVSVEESHELLVTYAEQRGIRIIIRGLRAVLDFDYEFQIALMNKKLSPGLETIFMLTNESHAYLSSTLIKELASYRADVSALVPPSVNQALKEHFGAGQ